MQYGNQTDWLDGDDADPKVLPEDASRPEDYVTPAQDIEKLASKEADEKALRSCIMSVDDIGDYKREEDDPNVLVFGPWLERGGSAFWVSTSGTGKSTSCMQFVHCASAGIPFAGLRPHGKLKFWVFQSEDSPRRVAQDRIDVRAELKDQFPNVNWDEVGKGIMFAKFPGKVGVEFLNALDNMLAIAERLGNAPDVIVLNPFLAYVGGPVTDGTYVTPFLRGGTINGEKTVGLQAVLENHRVGALIYHHTPKPPTEKELDAWEKSPYPEYHGAGSSDITNWGRSFIMMLRVKGHANMVSLTAGKNGGELGWERIGDAYRRFIAYSSKTGVSGRGRHAWRDLTPDEYDEVAGKEKNDSEKKCDNITTQIAEYIKENGAMTKSMIINKFAGSWSRSSLRLAADSLFANAQKYRLTTRQILVGRNWTTFIGLADIGLAEGLDKARENGELERRYLEAMGRC